MQISRRKVYDAIVVGSGATGGWAAKVLTEKGMNVLVLEAGKNINPDKDFRMMTWPYELKYRGLAPRDVYAPRQPIQSRCYAGNEYSHHFFVDDIDNPYTTPKDKPFWWIRGRQVGGRSIMWGRQTYRFSDYDFKAASHDGFGEDWPISYEELKPYYEMVENFIGISGQTENLPQLPDSNFIPPMAMTCGEKHFKKVVENRWNERNVTIGRVAILTKAHQGRAACHYCGHCDRGCDTFSYYSSLGSTLPAAAKTGRMTLLPNSIAREVIMDTKTGKAKGIRVINQLNMNEFEVYGKAIILCASTLESTRLLLNSKSRQHPNGLANSSGVLGHYLMDHVFQISHVGFVPQLRGNEYDFSDGRANGIYIPRFRNLKDKQKNFLRGYGMQASVSTGYNYGHGKQMPGFGPDFKKLVRENPREFSFWIGAFGEMLPRFENNVSIDPNKVDKWGVPVLHVDAKHGENEIQIAKDAFETQKEMVEAAGWEAAYSNATPGTPGFCIHEVGTARMGNDPKKSVLNKWNQSWDIKNLFITDGSSFVSQGCQNPTLTMMALTARACEYIVEQSKRGDL